MEKGAGKKIKLTKKQIDELFEKLKNAEASKEIEKENREEEIKTETKEIQAEQFQEFMRSSGRLITPILESGNSRKNVSIENEISEAPKTETRETPTRNYAVRSAADYVSRQTQEDLKKGYESKIETPVLTQKDNSQRRANFIDPLAQMNFQEKETTRPQLISGEFLEHERNLPFEREERKYKKTRM